jgi:hypothetical protein
MHTFTPEPSRVLSEQLPSDPFPAAAITITHSNIVGPEEGLFIFEVIGGDMEICWYLRKDMEDLVQTRRENDLTDRMQVLSLLLLD